MAGPLARLYATLGLDARQFESGIRSTEGVLGSMGGMATAGATAAGFALGGMAADGIAAYSQLDTKMREVFTLMPGISEDAKNEMVQDARDFAMQFGISTDEAIGGLYSSLSAGVPSDNVFAFMETAQKAATAGVTDLGSAVGLLSAVTKGYGDTSQEMTQKVSDLAFTTVRLGQTTFPELSASIGKVVPGAAALGIEVEDLNAVFATLTGVTGNTAEVATQWKSVQTALIKPTADMAKALEEQGIESGKVAIETLGLQGTLEMLQVAAGGSDEMLAKMLGSSESLTAVMQLTGGSAEKLTDNLEEMRNTTGATDTAFAEMDAGIEASGRKIAAFLNDLKLTVGKELQAFGPLFYAFGPNIGRWMGRGFGAAFGFVAAQIPRLMAPVIAKMSAVLAGSSIVQSVVSMLTSALGGPQAVAAAGTAGAKVGAAYAGAAAGGGLLGAVAGAAAAMSPIVIPIVFQEVLKDVLNVDAAGDLFAVTDTLKQGRQIKKLEDERLAVANELNARYGEQSEEVETLRGRFRELDEQIKALSTEHAAGLGLFADNGIVGLHDAVAEVTDATETADKAVRDAASKLADTGKGFWQGLTSAMSGGTTEVRQNFATMREAIVSGFGSIKEALAKGNKPSIIGRDDRIANMEKRQRKVFKNLHKAVQVDDPINVGYWSKAAIKQQAQLDKMRGKSDTSARDIRQKFKAMGVDIEGTWVKTRNKAKEATEGAEKDAKQNATDTVSGVTTIFSAANLYTDGARLISTWADGLIAGKAAAMTAASEVAAAVAAYFKIASPPKKGPLHTIDKDGSGLVDVWSRGIEGGAGRARHAAAVMAGAFAPAVGGPAAAEVGGMTINLQTYGTPMRADTPREIVQQLRRAARMGAMGPRAAARWDR